MNLIELVYSADVPAVNKQILAMNDLSPLTYYGYLLMYIALFLLDGTLILVVAMVTLRSVASTGRFSRISHLIRGPRVTNVGYRSGAQA